MKRAILVLAGVLIASSAWAGTAYFGGFTGETGTIQFPTWTGQDKNGVVSDYMVINTDFGATAGNNGKWTLKTNGRRNAGLWSTVATDWSTVTRSSAFGVPDIASPTVGQVAYTATMTAKLNTAAAALAAPYGAAGNPYIGFRMEPNKIAIRASDGKNPLNPTGMDNVKIGVALELQTDGLGWKFRDEQGNAQNQSWYGTAYSLRLSDTASHIVKCVITKQYVAMPDVADPLQAQLIGANYGYGASDPIAVVTIRVFVDGVDLGLYKWRTVTLDYTTVFDGGLFFVGGTQVVLTKDSSLSVGSGCNSDVSGAAGFTLNSVPYVDEALGADAYDDSFNIIVRGFPAEWVDPTITGTNVPDMNTSSIDYDQDGLPTTQEVELGLDATVSNINVDTDGDGVMDVEEVQLGLNPLVVDSNSDGYSDKVAASLYPTDPSRVILASELPVAGLAGLALLGLGLAAAAVRRVRK